MDLKKMGVIESSRREKIRSVKELLENKGARGRTFTVESRGEKQMLKRVDTERKRLTPLPDNLDTFPVPQYQKVTAILLCGCVDGCKCV